MIDVKLKGKCGIYFIRNIKNNKEYIGSSINVHGRLTKHMSLLRHGKHDNPILQSSFKKNGEESFIVGLYELVARDDLATKEEEYINKMNSYYNIRKEVIRPINTPEINKKHSDTKKRMFQNGELVVNGARKVDLYKINGEFVGTYSSVHKATYTGLISETEAFRMLRGEILESKGYFLKYHNDTSFDLDKILLSSLISSKKGIVVVENLDTGFKSYYTSISLFQRKISYSGKIRKALTKKTSIEFKINNQVYKIGLVKPRELLETPNIWDNQQLNIDGNIYRSSTTT
jgi:group I intron endonuclease